MRPMFGKLSSSLRLVGPRSIRGWGAILLLLIATQAIAVRTTLTHTALTTSGASQVALAANVSRNYFRIQNIDGTNTAACKAGAVAVANTGVVLSTLGSSGSIWSESSKVTIQAINCIANAGTPILVITEGVGP